MSITADATKTSQHRSHPVLDDVVSTTRHRWVLVAAGALLHGVGQIASAFVVRRVGRGAEAIGQG
jgi:hypothetical protein